MPVRAQPILRLALSMHALLRIATDEILRDGITWDCTILGPRYDDQPSRRRTRVGAFNHRRSPEQGSLRYEGASVRVLRFPQPLILHHVKAFLMMYYEKL